MAIRHHLFLVLSILSFHVELHAAVNITPNYNIASFNRTNFPAGFIFGTASASYPYEGAAQEGGKGQSIWDTFTHQHPDLIADHSNGDVAVDSYHRYKEDVQLLKNMNMPAYGLSISWPRILPTGKLSGGVNQEGIQYYNNLINELLANGITPFVTLFHWDLPQALEDEYIGFTSPLIVNDFVDYAETCFKAFGDRVKNWMTLNVPIAFSAGYAGAMAPMRCSAWQSENCKAGDSGVEPYLASHYQILAHAAAVNLYRNKYQAIQKGAIGIILATRWMVPYSNSVENVNATQRGLEFELGWFMNPLVNGDYPQVMKSIVGNRLPNFTVEESKMVKGSFDFIGMNYFHAAYAVDATQLRNANKSLFTDSLTILTRERNGNPFGLKSASDDINIYPKGIHDLLVYIKTKYNNPPIYITENGLEEMNNPELPLEEALADEMRVDFHYQHLFFLQKAIQEGINVKGYFCWSFLDSFEWNSGFTIRFGLHFVDYENGLKRYPKLSAQWFKNFLA